MPPLRERGDDIVQLAQHFLERAAADFGRPNLTLTRAQADKRLYQNTVRHMVESTPGLDLRQGQVTEILLEEVGAP